MGIRQVPQHVAIIMDGNGRWARARGLNNVTGHQKGADAIEGVIGGSLSIGVKVLTLYAFSMENWRRSRAEIEGLMALLRNYLDTKLPSLLERGIRLRAIGERERFPVDIQERLRRAEDASAANTDLTLVLALSYGSRQELVGALRRIAGDVARGDRTIGEIDESLVSGYLYTAGLPDPDLVIRTSGEERLSNFLLWQSSYAELYFSPVLWPDFTQEEFLNAVRVFQERERRFGQ